MNHVDYTKKDVCPMKAPAHKIHIEKSKPSRKSKNTPVVNHPEKENVSPATAKATQDGKIPPKNGKNKYVYSALSYL